MPQRLDKNKPEGLEVERKNKPRRTDRLTEWLREGGSQGQGKTRLEVEESSEVPGTACLILREEKETNKKKTRGRKCPGRKHRWVRSWKGYPIQHNSYPRLASTGKPRLGSQAAGALRCNNEPGDIKVVSHIFVPQKSSEEWNVNAGVLIACVCCLSSPIATGQGITFYGVLICELVPLEPPPWPGIQISI